MSLIVPIDYLTGAVPELAEGQWKLGEVLFGRGTPISVENIEVGPFEHKLSDVQISQTDEVRMGRDFFTPGTLIFTMGILNNRLLPQMARIAGNGGVQYPNPYNIVEAGPLLEKLTATWRNDSTRRRFGYVNYMRYCKFGVQKRIYGRPRKFTTNVFNTKNEFVPIVAEFARVDTLSFSDAESWVSGEPGSPTEYPLQVYRTGGHVATWGRFLIYGPINHPIIKVKDQFEIELNYNIPAGQAVEISAYPWERRIFNTLGQNLAPLLIGNTPYMEKMQFQPSSVTEVGMSGTSTNADTKLVVLWREAYATL